VLADMLDSARPGACWAHTTTRLAALLAWRPSGRSGRLAEEELCDFSFRASSAVLLYRGGSKDSAIKEHIAYRGRLPWWLAVVARILSKRVNHRACSDE
jgi:hypothetical protein